MEENKYTIMMRQKAKRFIEKGRFEEALKIYRQEYWYSEEASLLVKLNRFEEAVKAFLEAKEWSAAMTYSAHLKSLDDIQKVVGEAYSTARGLGEGEDYIRWTIRDTIQEIYKIHGIEMALNFMLSHYLSFDWGHWINLVNEYKGPAEKAGLFGVLAEIQLELIRKHEKEYCSDVLKYKKDYAKKNWEPLITLLRADDIDKALGVFENCFVGISKEDSLTTFPLCNTGCIIALPDFQQQLVLSNLSQAQVFYEGTLRLYLKEEYTWNIWPTVCLGQWECENWKPWERIPEELKKQCISFLASNIPFLRWCYPIQNMIVDSNDEYVNRCAQSADEILRLIRETEVDKKALEDSVLNRLYELRLWFVLIFKLMDCNHFEDALRLVDKLPYTAFLYFGQEFNQSEYEKIKGKEESLGEESRKQWRETILHEKEIRSAKGLKEFIKNDDLSIAQSEIDRKLALGEITKEEHETMSKQAPEVNPRICTSCGKSIKVEHIFCPFCGSKI